MRWLLRVRSGLTAKTRLFKDSLVNIESCQDKILSFKVRLEVVV